MPDSCSQRAFKGQSVPLNAFGISLEKAFQGTVGPLNAIIVHLQIAEGTFWMPFPPLLETKDNGGTFFGGHITEPFGPIFLKFGGSFEERH